MILLANPVWNNDDPEIKLKFEYEKQRSGADMKYRAKFSVEPCNGYSYFGFSIFLKITINGSSVATVTIKNPSPNQWSSNLTYTSSWVTVKNKTTGTTPISFRVYSESYLENRDVTFSYNMAIDPAASSFSVGNGTLGTSQNITVTKNNSAFTSTITYSCGSASGTICSKSTSTSIPWTPPLSLANQNTTGTSVSCKLTFETYSGNTLVGTSSKTISLSIPSSVKPTVSITVSDGAGLSGTYGGYVQSKSTIKVVVSASGSYGSSIKQYSTSANGATYTSSLFTTAVIKNSGTLTISTTVTDSRRRTATASKSITVLAYSSPRISSIDVIRSDSDGTANSSGSYLKVSFSPIVSSLNGKNTATYTIRYKKASSSTWTSASTSSTSYVFSAETASAYNVEVVATDKFSSVKATATGPTVSKFMSWFPKGVGVAFGKIAEFANTFEVAWKAIFHDGIYMMIAGRQRQPLRMFEGTSTGDGVLIGAGGRTIISGGEAGDTFLNEVSNWGSGAYEDIVIASDEGVNLTTNFQNGVSGVKTFSFGVDGSLQANGFRLYPGAWLGWYKSDKSSRKGYMGFTSQDDSDVSLRFRNEVYSEIMLDENTVRLKNGDSLKVIRADGNIIHLAGCSTSNNLYFGGSGDDEIGVADNTNIYAGGQLRFLPQRAGVRAAVLVYHREQSGSNRTILRCEENGVAYLGSTSYRWNTAFFTNAITASDLKEKEIVEDFDFKVKDFIMGLEPIAYRRKGNGDSGTRIHMGFGAQTVDALIKSINMGDMSIAQASVIDEETITEFDDVDNEVTRVEKNEKPFHGEEDTPDEKLSWGLNYNEFIAPIVLMLQEQQKEIEDLRNQIYMLKDITTKQK